MTETITVFDPNKNPKCYFWHAGSGAHPSDVSIENHIVSNTSLYEEPRHAYSRSCFSKGIIHCEIKFKSNGNRKNVMFGIISSCNQTIGTPIKFYAFNPFDCRTISHIARNKNQKIKWKINHKLNDLTKYGCSDKDSIKMVINFNDGTICYYKNHQFLGIMFANIDIQESYYIFVNFNGESSVLIEKCIVFRKKVKNGKNNKNMKNSNNSNIVNKRKISLDGTSLKSPSNRHRKALSYSVGVSRNVQPEMMHPKLKLSQSNYSHPGFNRSRKYDGDREQDLMKHGNFRQHNRTTSNFNKISNPSNVS